MGIMGPFAGQIFAQAGAQVTKCEPPSGDWARALGPFKGGHATDGRLGGLFVALARGKRRETVDFCTGEGRSMLQHLIANADVVLYGPELAEAGISDETISAWNPDLIRSYVAPVSQDGPYSEYETTCIQLLALGGIMGITGEPGREPLQIPGHHPEYIGGIHAFTATAAALVRRCRFPEGRGERVETSAFEAVAATAEMICTLYTYTGAVRSRFRGRQPWGIQGEVVPCKDGHIAVHPGALETLALVIGRPDLVEDRLFVDGIYRLTHAEEFLALLRPYLAERTRKEIIADCEALRVPFGAVLEVPDLLADEQLRARRYFDTVDIDGQAVRVPGPLFSILESPADADLVAGPAGVASGSPEYGQQPAAVGVRPLSGIRIIDLSWVWAGPSATRILADLGADVIKIEAPHRPDSVRALVQDRNLNHPDYWNRGGYFIEKNLGKRGMTLDLAKREGKDIFLDLLRRADVVVESFSPRVMSQLGLGFEQLSHERPGLIMISLSGYGQTGPGKNRVAYGAALEPESGITATIGYAGGPPVKSGLAYTDPISGVLAAGAILNSLRERWTADVPRSVHLDLAEREVVVPFVTEQIIEYQLNGRLPERRGNRHPDYWPQGCYPCAGHDRWIVISASNDDQWRALADLIGASNLRDLDVTDRKARVEEIDEAITRFCAVRDPYAAVRLLQTARVPSAPVQSGRDVLSDPQLRVRSFFASIDHPLVGPKEYHRFLGATFEKTIHASTRPAPLLDEHTADILRELGRDEHAIRALREKGVWGHQLVEGSRTNLALPLEVLQSIGAISGVDPLPQPRNPVAAVIPDTAQP